MRLHPDKMSATTDPATKEGVSHLEMETTGAKTTTTVGQTMGTGKVVCTKKKAILGTLIVINSVGAMAITTVGQILTLRNIPPTGTEVIIGKYQLKVGSTRGRSLLGNRRVAGGPISVV